MLNNNSSVTTRPHLTTTDQQIRFGIVLGFIGLFSFLLIGG